MTASAKMRRKSKSTTPPEQTRLVRLIKRVVYIFLFLCLTSFFGTIFQKLFGTSDVAWIIGFLVCVPLAGIVSTIICKAFPAILVLLLFAFPSLALILIFLLR